jgi:hypothetical protein
MHSRENHTGSSMIWLGRILTGLAASFMALDCFMKVVKPPQVIAATARLGFPLSTLNGIAAALFACILIYLIPRTSPLGAVLLTGYLGGAIASNVRAGSGWFETIFPALFALLVWIGLGLRDQRIRSLFVNRELSPSA